MTATFVAVEFERFGELPLVREAIKCDERLPAAVRDRLLARIDAVQSEAQENAIEAGLRELAKAPQIEPVRVQLDDIADEHCAHLYNTDQCELCPAPSPDSRFDFGGGE